MFARIIFLSLTNCFAHTLISYVTKVNFNISPDANCERWRWDSSGMEEFSKPLGPPLGPPLRSGNVFSRHFKHLSVKINIATEESEFIWGGSAPTPTGQPVMLEAPSENPTKQVRVLLLFRE